MTLVEAAAERHPESADVHFQRGRILSALQRPCAADSAYRQALARDPGYQWAWHARGRDALRQEEYRKALLFYQNEQEKHPGAAPLVGMARAYATLGRPDSARRFYERALAADGKDGEAHTRLAALHHEEGRIEKALKHQRQALLAGGEQPDRLLAMGTYLLEAGQPQTARKYLNAAVREQPWNPDARAQLAQTYRHLEDSVTAWRHAGLVDSLRRRRQEHERLQRAAAERPEAPRRWTRLAASFQQDGRYREAVEAYGRALYAAPESAGIRVNMALLHHALGNSDRAVAYAQAAVQSKPDFAEGWYNLGVLYAQQGETRKARRALQAALDHEPGHQRAQDYLAKLETSSPKPSPHR